MLMKQLVVRGMQPFIYNLIKNLTILDTITSDFSIQSMIFLKEMLYVVPRIQLSSWRIAMGPIVERIQECFFPLFK